MSASLAPSASVPATSDFYGSPAAGLRYADTGCDVGSLDLDLGTDPAASTAAVGSALRSLSAADATSVMDALASQATALSLILAADAGGAIRLPDSLRRLVEAASVLPAFLGGST